MTSPRTASLPANRFQALPATLLRRCMGCLFLMSCSLLPLTSQAQLSFLTSDPYGRLIFDAVPLLDDAPPGATTQEAANEDSPASSGSTPGLVTVREYRAAIDRTIEDDGLFSPLLLEQYRALADQQRNMGLYEDAVATLEQAIHIVRVNEGLVTPTQIEDLERVIDILQLSRDQEREAEFRAYLYYVHQQAYAAGDPRLTAATQAWANWNLMSYQQAINANPFQVHMAEGGRIEEYIAVRDDRMADVRFVPRRNFINQRGVLSDGGAFSVTAEMIVDYRLRLIRDTYAKFLENPDADLDIDTEEAIRLKLIDADYSFKRQIDSMLNQAASNSAIRSANSRREVAAIGRSYRNNVDTMQSLVDKRKDSEVQDPVAIARNLLYLGDIQLTYDQSSRAQAAYQEAYMLMLESGYSEADFTALMHPNVIVMVPDFATHLYSRALFGIGPDEELEYQGYMDVRMNISRNGESRRVSITQASNGTPQRIRSRLLTHLRGQKFRPHLQDGTFRDKNDIRVRFYYSY